MRARCQISTSRGQRRIPSARPINCHGDRRRGPAGGGAVALGEHEHLNVGTAAVTNAMLANPSVTVNGTTCTLGSTCTPSAGGGGNPTIDNCTPDETGNSFPTVTSLTNYFLASWQFVFSTTTYFNCTVYIPAQSGATVAVDVWSSDSTAGHGLNHPCRRGDQFRDDEHPDLSAANQTFTTTSTANNQVTNFQRAIDLEQRVDSGNPDRDCAHGNRAYGEHQRVPALRLMKTARQFLVIAAILLASPLWAGRSFNGSSEYITASGISTPLDISSGNETVSFWWYPTSSSTQCAVCHYVL